MYTPFETLVLDQLRSLKDEQSKANDKASDMAGKVSKIGEIVRRHDEQTFPEMQATLTRMESKHNQDYLRYVESREEIIARVEPLESEITKERMDALDEIVERNKDRKELRLEAGKSAVSTIVSSVMGGIVTLIGYLYYFKK